MTARTPRSAVRTLLITCVLGASPVVAVDRAVVAQRSEEDRPTIGREHFQLKVTPAYQRGDYGTDETTRLLVLPFTLRYLGDRLDGADRTPAAEAVPDERSRVSDRLDPGDVTERLDLRRRSARPATIERLERSERAERPERRESGDRPGRIERAERPDRPERIERAEKVDRPDRLERIERPERVERRERIERPEGRRR